MGPGAYKFLADALVIFHICFVGFVLLGGLVALVRRWVMFLHLPCMAWGIYVELSHRICPLTPLENSLRRQGNLATYSGSFVDHYIMPVLYPDGLTARMQVGIACVIITINAVAYGWILYSAVQRRRAGNSAFGDSEVGLPTETPVDGSAEVQTCGLPGLTQPGSEQR